MITEYKFATCENFVAYKWREVAVKWCHAVCSLFPLIGLGAPATVLQPGPASSRPVLGSVDSPFNCPVVALKRNEEL